MRTATPNQIKKMIVLAHDIVMAAASFVLALYLRLGSDGFAFTAPYLLPATLIFTAISVSVFLKMRLYKGIWRYASMQDLFAIFKSVSIAMLIFVPVMFLMTRMEGYPRSAFIINWMLLMGMLGAPRIFWRIYKDGGISFDVKQLTDTRIPVLLVGSGDEAELFIRNCSRKEESAYHVVGIVDDHALHVGRNIHGVRVYGDLSTLPRVMEKLKRKGRKPQKIIVADARLQGDKIRHLLEYAEEEGMSLARTPKLTDFRDTVDSKDPVAPIAIEDLLGRPQTTLDIKAIGKLLQGRRVMITGAGGTIGSELVRQIASFAPSTLLLIEQSEFALYQIDKELEDKKYGAVRYPIIADVRDRHYMQTICRQHKPEVIFHAAAIKHVPLAESNPHEAVMTNIIGTRNIADAARDCKADAMVMISTDKAVHPTSLMGATKRAAEIYCQSLGQEGAQAYPTRFMTVRFGNVLGSNGSVVPLFKKQLAAGGPITITHPDMVRYFMTVREAVELVLQAGAEPIKRQDGFKSGQIYVLDMGEPVKIKDLAEHMIRLSGLRPGEDIAVETVGIRPGEKLFEELFYHEESQKPAHHPGLMLAHSQHADYKRIQRIITAMENAAVRRNTAKMYSLLHEIVEAYRPSSLAENRPTMPTVFAHAGSHRHH
jgi:FlaA1/EpsC-like NDP-sugar epimerase